MRITLLHKISKMLAAACLAWAAAGCDPTVVYDADPGLSAPSAAGAGRPSFNLEDEFWYRAGRRAIVIEVFKGEEDGLLVFYRPNEQEYWYFTPDLALTKIRRPFGTDRWFKPDDGQLDFPLTPGKTWARDFRIVSADGSREVRRSRKCQVADSGELEIAGERLAAFRILCTLRTFGEVSEGREEVYYAPEIGRIVLRQSIEGGPDWRLFEYTRAE